MNYWLIRILWYFLIILYPITNCKCLQMSNNEKSIHFLNIQIILVLWKQGWTNPQHGALLWTDRNVFNFWAYFCLSNWRHKTSTSFGPGCDLTNLWPKHGEWILIFWYFSLPQLIYLMSIQFNRDSTHLHNLRIYIILTSLKSRERHMHTLGQLGLGSSGVSTYFYSLGIWLILCQI